MQRKKIAEGGSCQYIKTKNIKKLEKRMQLIYRKEYKCENKGIKFVSADRFYALSKICSCCGKRKKDLKMRARIYEYLNHRIKIDSDLNSSINLSKYKVA